MVLSSRNELVYSTIGYDELEASWVFTATDISFRKKELDKYLEPLIRETFFINDFRKLLEFMTKLLQEVEDRQYGEFKEQCDENGCTVLKNKLMNNIIFYYEKLMNLYQTDKMLAVKYFTFIINNSFNHWTIPRRIEIILEALPNEPVIIHHAVTWYTKTDYKKATKIVLAGLKKYPQDKVLNLDLLEVDSVYAEPENLNKIRSHVDLIDKNMNEMDFLIEVMKKLGEKTILRPICAYVMDRVLKKYKLKPEAWHAVAIMELNGCYCVKAKLSDLQPTFALSLERSVKCFRKGLKAVAVTNAARLWALYLETLHNDYEKRLVNGGVESIYHPTIKSLVQEAILSKELVDPRFSILWIGYCDDKRERELVADKAIKDHPNNPTIWVVRISIELCAFDYKKALTMFIKARIALRENSLDVWNCFYEANMTHDFTDMETLLKSGTSEPYEHISRLFKIRHMNYVAENLTKYHLRNVYERYTFVDLSQQDKEFYEIMLRVEKADHDRLDIRYMSSVYSRYAAVFGHAEPRIWHDWANLCKPSPPNLSWKHTVQEAHRLAEAKEIIMHDFEALRRRDPKYVIPEAQNLFLDTIHENVLNTHVF